MKKVNNKNSNKKNITIGLSLVLVIALAIGGTLAYLSMESNSKENDFSFAEVHDDNGFSIILVEPDWDGDDGGYDDYETELDDGDLGEEMAKEVQPGDYIPKNPFVINSSSPDLVDSGIWVAIKMEFYKGNGDRVSDSELEHLMEIMDFYYKGEATKNEDIVAENPKTWTYLGQDAAYTGSRDDQDVYFYYNDSIEAGEATAPLFDHVYFSLEDMTNEDADELKNEWEGLNIKLQGYAIQEKNIPYEQMPDFFEDLLINEKGDGSTLNYIYDPANGTFTPKQ